jgi:hypothetical protein
MDGESSRGRLLTFRVERPRVCAVTIQLIFSVTFVEGSQLTLTTRCRGESVVV